MFKVLRERHGRFSALSNSQNRLLKKSSYRNETKTTGNSSEITDYWYDLIRLNGIKTSFVWNGQNLAGETKNGTTTSYTYDSTGIILSDNGTDTTRYIKDPHGSVAATSRNNTIIGEYDYTAFGNQTECTDTSNPFRYCGEYYDDENDMVYLRNRYYNSTTGRFITEDPVKDGLNWYSYCGGNPVIFVDSLGLARHVDENGNSTIPADLDWDGDGRLDTAEDRARFDADNNGIADWREYFSGEGPNGPDNSISAPEWYQCRNVKILNDYPFTYQGNTNFCWAAAGKDSIHYVTGNEISLEKIVNDRYNYEISTNGEPFDRDSGYAITFTAKFIKASGYLNGSGYKLETINMYDSDGDFTFEFIKGKINSNIPIVMSTGDHAWSVIGYAFDEELGKKYMILYSSNDNKIPISEEYFNSTRGRKAYSFAREE